MNLVDIWEQLENNDTFAIHWALGHLKQDVPHGALPFVDTVKVIKAMAEAIHDSHRQIDLLTMANASLRGTLTQNFPSIGLAGPATLQALQNAAHASQQLSQAQHASQQLAIAQKNYQIKTGAGTAAMKTTQDPKPGMPILLKGFLWVNIVLVGLCLAVVVGEFTKRLFLQ